MSADEAKAQYESIVEMVDALRSLQGDPVQRIHEDVLSVLVRSGWVEPGKPMEAEEYELLLCTGGPAVRIRGQLNEHHEPSTARLEHQDWGTPWTKYHEADEDYLRAYASVFYYGV